MPMAAAAVERLLGGGLEAAEAALEDAKEHALTHTRTRKKRWMHRRAAESGAGTASTRHVPLLCIA